MKGRLRQMEVKERSQVPEQYKWDLSGIYASDEAFLEALAAAQGMPARLEAHKDTACASAAGLLAFLREQQQVDVELGKLSNYAERKSDEDTRVATYQDFCARVTTLWVQAGSACSWYEASLLACDPQVVQGWFAEEPQLEEFRRSIDRTLAQRAHVLSPAEEALLASAGELGRQPENVFGMFSDADLTFPDAVDSQGQAHPVTHGTFVPLERSCDRALRQSAYESLYGVYDQFKNTSAAMLASQVKMLKFFSDARHYASSMEGSLAANEVPAEVYTNLIEAVRRNLGAMHRYVALRKRLLGVDELRFWDVYVPMVKDFEMHFTYEQACDTILAALEPMGPDYLAIVRHGFESRWVDVYENPGKRSGAYSAGGYGMQPVILMNFQGTLDDVFTLVHEMGHSVHTYLSCKNQPSQYSNYPIFVAEVASTCNEALLMHYLLEHAGSDAERAYLLDHHLEQFKGTIYRQCMFAEFELEAGRMNARGEGLTAQALCDLYRRLNEDYFGPEMVVDDQIALEWSRIPHFYYDHYVYQYATGYAAAIALSQRILNEGAPAVADYLGFLSGGCSKPPIDLLRGAGVDMATPAPVDAALAYFDQLIGELEELLG